MASRDTCIIVHDQCERQACSCSLLHIWRVGWRRGRRSRRAAGATQCEQRLRSSRLAAARWCRASGPPSSKTPRGRPGCAQVLHRLACSPPSAAVSPWAMTRSMWSSGVGLQPDGDAVGEQRVEGRRIGHDPARRRDHRFACRPDRLLERAPLVAAVGVGAVQRVDLADAAARDASRSRGSARRTAPRGRRPACGPSVDLPAPRRPISAIRPAARRSSAAGAEQLGRAPRARAQVGFVAAAQHLADQQPFGRRGGDVADQLGDRALQRPRDLRSTRIDALPCRTPGWRDAAPTRPRPGDRLARHAAARAQRADALAQAASRNSGSCGASSLVHSCNSIVLDNDALHKSTEAHIMHARLPHIAGQAADDDCHGRRRPDRSISPRTCSTRIAGRAGEDRLHRRPRHARRYGELDERARRFAAALLGLGLAPRGARARC